MDFLKDHAGIITKSQSRWGQLQFLLSFALWSVAIVTLGVYYSKDKAIFKCDANENFSLVNQFCYERYAEVSNSPLPQLAFALINGCVLIGIWLTFALYLGPKLQKFKRRTPDEGHAERGLHQLHMRDARDRENKCISVYCSYFLQIFIRVVFLVSMVALLLSYQTFKLRQSFTCLLTIEEENINTICSDPYIQDKQRLNIAMLIFDVILIFLAIVETAYMLIKNNLQGRRQASATADSESGNLLESGVHVFSKRYICWGCPIFVPSDADFVAYLLSETLQEGPNETTFNIRQCSDDLKQMIIENTTNLALAVPLPLPFNSLSTDSLYTTVVFRSEVANRTSNAHTEQLGEIFERDDGNTTRKANNIMVYGCAGIGKSMFCQKLSRDWATGVLSLTNGERLSFQFVFLLNFRNLNFITGNISLTRLLTSSTFARIDEDTCRWIMKSIPSSMLIIFDGLQEFNSLSSCTEDLFSYADDLDAEMPVSAWYTKLVSGRILKGCTVITTSRPDALHALPTSCQYDKVVKLCGFTIEKAKEFIGKLLEGEPEARASVFDLISSNQGIESLVCIPENCIIISCYFLYKARTASENNNQSSTLTDIYDNLLRLYTKLHNPNCRGTIPASEFPQAVLSSLFALAYNGIESGTPFFTRRDIAKVSRPQGVEPLIRSGLLNGIPLTQTGPADFDTPYFFNSTMQDFLAAKHIVTTLSETVFVSVVRSSGMNTKWDLVLQFVAGLLKPLSEEKMMRTLLHGLQANLAQSKERSEGEQLLLAARCCFEYNDDSITKSELAATLKGCIDLRACQSHAGDSKVIIYLLSRCRPGAITSLLMFNSFLRSEECEELGQLIASRHGPMEELDVSNNNIGNCGVERFCRALSGSRCRLKHLNLSGNGISSFGTRCLLDVLRECPLQTLNLACNAFDYGNARQLSDMLLYENFPLNNLSVAGCGIQDPVIKCLFPLGKFHSIQELDVSDNNLSENGIEHLAKTLLEHEYNLHSLQLRGNSLSYNSLKRLIKNLTHRHCKLQRLDLASTGIADNGVHYIAKRLRKGDCKLKYLDISDNNFGNVGCLHIAKAVAAPLSVLEELNIQRNEISDRVALRLLNCFKNSNFSSLYLSGNNISEPGKTQLLCYFLEQAFHWEQSQGKLYV